MNQYTLFGGEVPAPDKPRARRKQAAPAKAGTPIEMFSAKEIAQFGVTSKPLISLSPGMPLPLEMQDPRSEEEREANRLQAEREAMIPLPLDDTPTEEQPKEDHDEEPRHQPRQWGGIDWTEYDELCKLFEQDQAWGLF